MISWAWIKRLLGADAQPPIADVFVVCDGTREPKVACVQPETVRAVLETIPGNRKRVFRVPLQ